MNTCHKASMLCFHSMKNVLSPVSVEIGPSKCFKINGRLDIFVRKPFCLFYISIWTIPNTVRRGAFLYALTLLLLDSHIDRDDPRHGGFNGSRMTQQPTQREIQNAFATNDDNGFIRVAGPWLLFRLHSEATVVEVCVHSKSRS